MARRRTLHRFSKSASLHDIPRREELPTVSRSAIAGFQADHSVCGAAAAEAQLRELLEDLLAAGDDAVVVTRGGDGEWGILSKKPYGYSLLLSPDGAMVWGYLTIHASRTYAKVKADRAASAARHQEMLKPEVDEAKLYAYGLAREVAREGLSESHARVLAERRGVLDAFEGKLERFRRWE